MLERARERVPRAEFLQGELHQRPVPDDHEPLAYRHLASDYLSAALQAGLQVRRCEEPRSQGRDDPAAEMAQDIDPGPWDQWPWSLLPIVPAASGAVWKDTPCSRSGSSNGPTGDRW